MEKYHKPLPQIDEMTRPYWEYCKNHELRMQKCSNCGYIRFPVSTVCPHCLSMEYEWTPLSGKGTVYSYVIYRQAYHPAYKKDVPYAVAVIQLEEGPRMESNITGCEPDSITIGMPVEVYFDDVTDKIALPKFRPAR